MTVELVFVDAVTCEFRNGSALLARYRAETGVAIKESPKPCLHPVYSIEGELITDFQPADHPWHHGIAWAFTYVDGDTFWGGPTFQDSVKGYGWLENHGSQRHVSWHAEAASSCHGAGATLVQTVHWISSQGNVLLHETRKISGKPGQSGMWQLHFSSEFTNITDAPLSLASPVCKGRPEGGYFGLMWRGPASWAHGRVFSAAAETEMMGQPARWLVYERASFEGKTASLLFVDYPSNPRFPNRWFIRNQDQPLASFAFAYSEPYLLAPQVVLRLEYTIAIIDSPLSPKAAEEIAQDVLTSA